MSLVLPLSNTVGHLDLLVLWLGWCRRTLVDVLLLRVVASSERHEVTLMRWWLVGSLVVSLGLVT